PEAFVEMSPGVWRRGSRNILTTGHHDVHARLRDMNFDGVVGEVIFHGSQNDEPIPFTNLGDPTNRSFFKSLPPEHPELAAVGAHIYNQWLADFCSVEPHRHAGLAQLPVWDVDASVREAEWARDAGLRGLNFPNMHSWLPRFDNPVWEP